MFQNTHGPDCRIFKSNKALDQNNEKAWFLYADTNSWKLKVD